MPRILIWLTSWEWLAFELVTLCRASGQRTGTWHGFVSFGFDCVCPTLIMRPTLGLRLGTCPLCSRGLLSRTCAAVAHAGCGGASRCSLAGGRVNCPSLYSQPKFKLQHEHYSGLCRCAARKLNAETWIQGGTSTPPFSTFAFSGSKFALENPYLSKDALLSRFLCKALLDVLNLQNDASFP